MHWQVNFCFTLFQNHDICLNMRNEESQARVGAVEGIIAGAVTALTIQAGGGPLISDKLPIGIGTVGATDTAGYIKDDIKAFLASGKDRITDWIRNHNFARNPNQQEVGGTGIN